MKISLFLECWKKINNDWCFRHTVFCLRGRAWCFSENSSSTIRLKQTSYVFLPQDRPQTSPSFCKSKLGKGCQPSWPGWYPLWSSGVIVWSRWKALGVNVCQPQCALLCVLGEKKTSGISNAWLPSDVWNFYEEILEGENQRNRWRGEWVLMSFSPLHLGGKGPEVRHGVSMKLPRKQADVTRKKEGA